MPNELKLDRWKQFWQDANADASWKSFRYDEDKTRAQIVPEMLKLLDRFLSSGISLEQFRAEFDQRTRTDWTVFGLKGLSGAMFLNMLTKYIPDREEITRQLRAVLPAPADEEQARQRLSAFVDYLNGVIERKEARRRKLQPARAPYLVSAWWHLQKLEQWPIFYQSGRKVLELEGAYNATGNPVDDYFLFRHAFQTLAAALQISSWSCEHLLDRCHVPKPKSGLKKKLNGEGQKGTTATPVPPDDGGEDDGDAGEKVAHAQVQWLLATIGRKLGCQIWIASNDHSKEWDGQSLGDLSIDQLPTLGLDQYAQKLISLIDVVWLKGKQIVAAFEVEHTTSIYSGLLRLSDLVVECPNLNFPLYIVTPEKRLPKVRRELSRATFQSLELHKRCGFFSDEALLGQADAILQWATDPSVLDNLAESVSDTSA